ncbi:DUF2460 domain-containing protein [Cucumibacter marinus]|uniref:DUF2460 domain-containing protein n=1 Tax=Cucumibacter marinus TaxID=1121252 RepID=UPI00042508DA|nr:DUF2460 domain-containing protein [Cucumibacter marinus]
MAFHPVRFPADIALAARGGPERLTEVTTLANGAETRNSRWAGSRRRFNAGYGVKSRADLAQVIAFFEERRGRLHTFLFRDPLDHGSGPPGAGITPLDQEIGTGDGTETAFQLVKRYGGTFDPYDRRITKPVEGSVRTAVAGVELSAPADFAVDTETGLVTFAAPPANGQPVTAGFQFDCEVRFDSDRLDIELSSFDAAAAPDITLVEVV